MLQSFDAGDRLSKMKNLIVKIGKDKQDQIVDGGVEQYKTEKQNIVQEQKQKIIEEYEQKHAEQKIKVKIENSQKQNEYRLSKMQARFDQINKLKEEMKTQCKNLLKDSARYKTLMKELMIESLIKLMENSVEIQCRKADIELVKSLVDEVQKEFKAKVKQECGRDLECKITVSDQNLEGIKKNCIGGIVASSLFGRIVCSNTLEDRIELVFQEYLPEIRSNLFPDYK